MSAQVPLTTSHAVIFFFPFLVLKNRGQISVTKHKEKDIFD